MKTIEILTLGIVLAALTLAGAPPFASAHDPAEEQPAPGAHAEHGSLAEIGKKLADPTSNVWALFTEFDLSFSDGDVNAGNPKPGGDMIFQPILPIHSVR
jgi:hypothetical protein